MALLGIGEAAIAAAGVALYSGMVKTDKKTLEEREADNLYTKFFGLKLQDIGGGEVTVRDRKSMENVEPLAVNCVNIIQTYQSHRRKVYMRGLIDRPDSFSGDPRTVILEELKDWLLTVPKGNDRSKIPVATVFTRLNYCRQLLLRPDTFKTENEISFLQTIANVCTELDKLHREMLKETKINADRLDHLFHNGKELIEASLTIFLYALSNDVVHRARSENTPSKQIELDLLLASANKTDEVKFQDVDWNTEAGKGLQEVLSTSYFKALYLEGAHSPEAQAMYAESYSPSPQDEKSVEIVLGQLRTAWTSQEIGEKSGLLEPFRSAAHINTRSSYITLMLEIDRLAYWLHKMRLFKELGWQAGDIAMCRLHTSLSHLLQELEKDLVLFRQAWLEVMRGAKKELLVATKEKPDKTQTYWLQGLRHIDAVRAGELYHTILDLCNEIMTATSQSRAYELEQNAMKGINNIVDIMKSGAFQTRCTNALPASVANEAIQDAKPQATIQDSRQ